MSRATSTWKAFAENKLTHTTAHYLMTIRELLEVQGYARMVDVAQDMQLAKSTVSAQIKSMIEHDLVVEDHARHLKLSIKGESLAREVIHNRAILRHFLEKVLGAPGEQAEADACKMEHLLSPDTSSRLLALCNVLQEQPDMVQRIGEHLSSQAFSCPAAEECAVCDTECLS